VSLDGGPRIAIGCVDAVPHRARSVEAKLDGDLSLEAARAAVVGLGETLDPPADVHAPAEYRQALAEVVVARAIVQAAGR
jgi:aerobic carbon-monoxide dehydrogenase medium subunit